MKASPDIGPALFSSADVDLAILPPRFDIRRRVTRRGLPLWVSVNVFRACARDHPHTTSSIDFCNDDTLRGHTLSKLSVPRA